MDPAGVLQLQQLITRIINLAAALAFLALLVMFIYAGFKYLTSNGDPKALQSAHQTVIWAVLGVIFLVLAWLILKLIEAFTGVQVTQFCIGFPGAPTYCGLGPNGGFGTGVGNPGI